MARRLSTSGIYRLALYNRFLSNLDRDESDFVSSQELADATGHNAAQVRKDLTAYGSLGEPSKGYEIGKLKALLVKIFGKEKVRNVVLIGVGNIGMALIAYRGFQQQGFNIVASFDRDIRKINKQIENVTIYDIQDMEPIIANKKAEMAIVSVPANAAQEIVNRLVTAGVKAILNFAPINVIVPEDVELQNVDMSIELDRLYYLLKNPS